MRLPVVDGQDRWSANMNPVDGLWYFLYRANRVVFTSALLRNPLATALRAVQDKRIVSMELRDGTVIENVPGNYSLLDLVYEIFVKNVYCREIPVRGNDLVVDIGANVGVFTLFAGKRTRGHVYAIEPVAALVEGLNNNVRRNALHNVSVHPGAAGGRDDLAGATTLQRFMDEQGIAKIDFLKIDCEGAEGEIFKSLPTEYLDRIENIALESHDRFSILKHAELENLFQDHGFQTRSWKKPNSDFGYLYAARRFSP